MSPSTTDICDLTLEEVAEALRERQVSPREVVAATLARIDRLDPVLNAYLRVQAEAAMTAAVTAEAEIAAGAYRGPLHGVPVGVKDFFDVAGLPTTCGSRALADRVAVADATVVARLKAAGAIVVGKHNMHELGLGATNENPHFGNVRNPWHLEHSPGGSSGGSAAAVAAGMAFAALGTDTGCSVRVPAAACGVVGLKPTLGRVSRAGVGTISWSLDHVGPLARTTRDVGIVLRTIAGEDPRDPFASAEAVPDYPSLMAGGVRGLRLGVPRDTFFDDLQPGVGEAVQAVVETLVRSGAQAVDVSMPWAALTLAVGSVLARSETTASLRPDLERLIDEGVPDVVERLVLGLLIPAETYVTAQRARRLLQERARATFEHIDLLVAPVWPCLPPRIGSTSAPVKGGEPFGRAAIRLTMPFSVLGLPAIAVPCGFSPAGLPYSVQIVGRPFEETRVLGAAHAYEQAHAWHRRRP